MKYFFSIPMILIAVIIAIFVLMNIICIIFDLRAPRCFRESVLTDQWGNFDKMLILYDIPLALSAAIIIIAGIRLLLP